MLSSRKAKQIATTISAVLGGSAMLVGLLADGPGVVKNLIANGPWVLQQPMTYWIAGIVLIEAVAMYLIWRQPDETNIRSYLRTIKGRVPENISLRVCRLSELLDDARKHANPGLGTMLFLGNKYVQQKFQKVYASRIKELLGEEAAVAYASAVESNFSQAGFYTLIYEQCYSRIEHLVLNEIAKELDSQGTQNAPRLAIAQPNASDRQQQASSLALVVGFFRAR